MDVGIQLIGSHVNMPDSNAKDQCLERKGGGGGEDGGETENEG